MIKRGLLKIYANLIKKVGLITINSSCVYGFHQPKEPESLKRFKRIKD